MDQFILFGDSITQQSFSQDRGFGFGAALADIYARKLDVINRGLSGYNTSQALWVLPKIIPHTAQARVRFLTIFFGANDARLPNTPGPSQTISLEQYKENLKAIVKHPVVDAQRKCGMRVILITPPPIDERLTIAADKVKYPGITVIRRTADNTARYAQVCRDVGAELDVPVLDIWTSILAQTGWASNTTVPLPGLRTVENAALATYLHDGLHFTGEAYKVLFQDLMTLIRVRFPDQVPERLPNGLPPWDDEEAWENEEAMLDYSMRYTATNKAARMPPRLN